jgi:TPR repeat protein
MITWTRSIAAAFVFLMAAPALADATLDAAIKTCDSEAGTPMSGVAGVPEVYTSDLAAKLWSKDRKIDMQRYQDIFNACFAASNAKDAHPRFRYQMARLQAMLGLGDPNMRGIIDLAMPVLLDYAKQGWPDAQYTLVEVGPFAQFGKTDEGRRLLGTFLLAAAEAGHPAALYMAHTALMQSDGLYFPGQAADPVRAAKYLAILAKGAPLAPPGPGVTWLQSVRYDAQLRHARIVTNLPDFSAAEKQAAFDTIKSLSDAGDEDAMLSYATSLEKGRSTAKNLPQAITLYEELTKKARNRYVAESASASIAGLLLSGAVGKPDPARARAMMEKLAVRQDYMSADVLAVLVPMLTDGKYFPREPRRALTLLEKNLYREDNAIQMAQLLLQTRYSTKRDKDLIATLSRAAIRDKNKAAALALGRLAAAELHPYNRAPESLEALAPFAAKDVDARLLLARLTLRNLASTSFKPFLDPKSSMTKAVVLAAIAEGEAQGHPEALITKALMLRRGFLFPQDDRGASKLLIQAAEAGDVEAKVLAADAYREGLGVKRNDEKAVALWRSAAKAGSLEGREALFSNFPFLGDITLREYVGTAIALFANGEGFRFGDDVSPDSTRLAGVFINGRMLENNPSAIAEALLASFRHVPAATADEVMVAIAKAQTDEVRVAVETALKRAGFYKGETEGFFDPAVSPL